MADDLLDNYNPLYDVHLKQYFASPHMQKHLRRIGLLRDTSENEANGESEVYARHNVMMDLMLKNREKQLAKLAALQKKLTAAEKVEICRKIRSGQTPGAEARARPSRSLSRGRRGAPAGLRGERRSSTSTDDRDFIKKIEADSEEGSGLNPKSVYGRLSASVGKYRYLHKLDDHTLSAYMEELRKQLGQLERFRDVSFGPHNVARHPHEPQESWFFRRRSLPSFSDSGQHANSVHEHLRKVRSGQFDKPQPPRVLNGANVTQSNPINAVGTQPTRLYRLPKIRNNDQTASAQNKNSDAIMLPVNRSTSKTRSSRSTSKKRNEPVRVQKPKNVEDNGLTPLEVVGTSAIAHEHYKPQRPVKVIPRKHTADRTSTDELKNKNLTDLIQQPDLLPLTIETSASSEGDEAESKLMQPTPSPTESSDERIHEEFTETETEEETNAEEDRETPILQALLVEQSFAEKQDEVIKSESPEAPEAPEPEEGNRTPEAEPLKNDKTEVTEEVEGTETIMAVQMEAEGPPEEEIIGEKRPLIEDGYRLEESIRRIDIGTPLETVVARLHAEEESARAEAAAAEAETGNEAEAETRTGTETEAGDEVEVESETPRKEDEEVGTSERKKREAEPTDETENVAIKVESLNLEKGNYEHEDAIGPEEVSEPEHQEDQARKTEDETKEDRESLQSVATKGESPATLDETNEDLLKEDDTNKDVLNESSPTKDEEPKVSAHETVLKETEESPRMPEGLPQKILEDKNSSPGGLEEEVPGDQDIPVESPNEDLKKVDADAELTEESDEDNHHHASGTGAEGLEGAHGLTIEYDPFSAERWNKSLSGKLDDHVAEEKHSVEQLLATDLNAEPVTAGYETALSELLMSDHEAGQDSPEMLVEKTSGVQEQDVEAEKEGEEIEEIASMKITNNLGEPQVAGDERLPEELEQETKLSATINHPEAVAVDEDNKQNEEQIQKIVDQLEHEAVIVDAKLLEHPIQEISDVLENEAESSDAQDAVRLISAELLETTIPDEDLEVQQENGLEKEKEETEIASPASVEERLRTPVSKQQDETPVAEEDSVPVKGAASLTEAPVMDNGNVSPTEKEVPETDEQNSFHTIDMAEKLSVKLDADEPQGSSVVIATIEQTSSDKVDGDISTDTEGADEEEDIDAEESEKNTHFGKINPEHAATPDKDEKHEPKIPETHEVESEITAEEIEQPRSLSAEAIPAEADAISTLKPKDDQEELETSPRKLTQELTIEVVEATETQASSSAADISSKESPVEQRDDATKEESVPTPDDSSLHTVIETIVHDEKQQSKGDTTTDAEEPEEQPTTAAIRVDEEGYEATPAYSEDGKVLDLNITHHVTQSNGKHEITGETSEDDANNADNEDSDNDESAVHGRLSETAASNGGSKTSEVYVEEHYSAVHTVSSEGTDGLPERQEAGEENTHEHHDNNGVSAKVTVQIESSEHLNGVGESRI